MPRGLSLELEKIFPIKGEKREDSGAVGYVQEGGVR